jgi:hypothetical protein|tara:strand:+ start:3771 stop:4016 length:246 start_codon:yes stop_codon:yes gene_type:complete
MKKIIKYWGKFTDDTDNLKDKEKLHDSPYWLISECCGANVDEEKPFEYTSLLYLEKGICSKCNKESEFYDKHGVWNGVEYE